MYLAQEVALDNRVSDLGDTQLRRDLPADRRLANTGPATDEQDLRMIHHGSVSGRIHSAQPTTAATDAVRFGVP